MTYSIGVTTSPRSEETITKTLTSLTNSGFSNIRVFAEPKSYVPEGYVVSRREKQYGCWRNWFFGLKELYEKVNTDWYIMTQDDILVCRNVGAYIETLVPRKNIGFYSLFTPSQYRGPELWNEVSMGSKLWMAQFLALPREVVPLILLSKEVWRFPGDRGIDNRLGLWAKHAKRKVYYHTPSLVSHIGHTSTLWPNASSSDGRQESDFVGEDFDCLSLTLQPA